MVVELPKLVCSESLNTDSTHSVGGCVYVDGHSLRLPHSDSKLYAVKSPTSDMTHSTCTTSGTVSHTQLSQSCSSENSKKSSSQNSLVVNAAPSCRRNLVADFEKHLTFRPKLNDYSLKIVSKTARNSVPVVHRLLEGRKALQISPYEQNLTFQPKLNTLSVKLAQERTTRIPEVQARMSEVAAARTADAMAQYSFKPAVSQRSLRIAQNLGTTFLVRQKIHLERRQRVQEEPTRSPTHHHQQRRRRRLIRLTPRALPPTDSSSQLEGDGGSHALKSEESCSSASSSFAGGGGGGGGGKPLSLAKPATLSQRTHTTSAHKTAVLHSVSQTTSDTLKQKQKPLDSPQANSEEKQHSLKTPTSPQRHRLHRSYSSPQATRKAPPKTRGSLHSRSGSGPVKRSSSPPHHVISRLEEAKFNKLNESDRVRRIKMKVERIARERKVFLIRGGYRTIRCCLRKRGWVQLEYNQIKQSQARGPPLRAAAGHAHRKQWAGSGGGSSSRRGSKDSGRGVSSDSSDSEVDILSHSEEELSDEDEYCMLSRGLRNCPPHFVWSLRRDLELFSRLGKDVLCNHFSIASTFTTKVGLCTNLQQLLWFGDTDPHSLFPRCYRLACDEERAAFIDDYRFTAALNILKMLPNQYAPNAQPTHSINTSPVGQNTDHQPVVTRPSPAKTRRISSATSRPHSSINTDSNTSSPSKSRPSSTSVARPSSASVPRPSSSDKARPSAPSTRPPSSSGGVAASHLQPDPLLFRPVLGEEVVGLAMKACENFLGSKNHDDIEGSQLQLCPKLTEGEWRAVVHSFYCMAFDGALVSCSCYVVSKTKEMLAEVEPHFPQIHMDGKRNIWIVKPGALSRGRGIVCLDRLESILELVGGSTVQKKEGRLVVQKYIERPLLIHDTKFDIRQWFLVTDWNPLTMWMYRDCYLRFSTQLYTLDNLDESVHLCNNSIQKHYQNTTSRSQALPATNMWDCQTFREFLRGRGEGGRWESQVYPDMKQALVHVLQVTQDEVHQRKNAFELFGADFILSEDLKPWLIEINCSPAMEASTEITKRLCREVMEDTIKVVVDRREDKDCDIGKFELAFKQPRTEVPPYVGMQLCVTGSTIHKPRDGSHTHPHRHHPPSLPSPASHHHQPHSTTVKLTGVKASLSTGIS